MALSLLVLVYFVSTVFSLVRPRFARPTLVVYAIANSRPEPNRPKVRPKL